MIPARLQQIAAFDAIVVPPDGWTKSAEPILLTTDRGVKPIAGALVCNAFAIHPAIDVADPDLHLRLTHVPTGRIMSRGADPLSLAELAWAWGSACDWRAVAVTGDPVQLTIDIALIAERELFDRLGELREDYENWQRGLVRAAAGAA